MTFERSDFDALNKTKVQQQVQNVLPQLRMMQQAAVSAERLTGVLQWDLFLAFLQGAIETTRKQLEAFQTAMNSPDLLDSQKVLQCKVSALRCAERIAAWEAVIALPKDLIELGEKAEVLVSRMEKVEHAADN